MIKSNFEFLTNFFEKYRETYNSIKQEESSLTNDPTYWNTMLIGRFVLEWLVNELCKTFYIEGNNLNDNLNLLFKSNVIDNKTYSSLNKVRKLTNKAHHPESNCSFRGNFDDSLYVLEEIHKFLLIVIKKCEHKNVNHVFDDSIYKIVEKKEKVSFNNDRIDYLSDFIDRFTEKSYIINYNYRKIYRCSTGSFEIFSDDVKFPYIEPYGKYPVVLIVDRRCYLLELVKSKVYSEYYDYKVTEELNMNPLIVDFRTKCHKSLRSMQIGKNKDITPLRQIINFNAISVEDYNILNTPNNENILDKERKLDFSTEKICTLNEFKKHFGESSIIIDYDSRKCYKFYTQTCELLAEDINYPYIQPYNKQIRSNSDWVIINKGKSYLIRKKDYYDTDKGYYIYSEVNVDPHIISNMIIDNKPVIINQEYRKIYEQKE